jgi:hypothetical protein
MAPGKEVHEIRDVITSLSQRRYLHPHHVETKLQILAEASGAHLRDQILTGRSDHSHIHG